MLALPAESRGVHRVHAHFATRTAEVASAAHQVTGIPYSLTCHAFDIYKEPLDVAALRRLIGDADFAVTVCDANLQYLKTLLRDTSNSNLIRIYNGVDLNFFHPRYREEAPVPLILSVARLVEKKGLDDLIRAVASLENAGHRFRCVIVGEGYHRIFLEKLIAELGCRQVEIIGEQTQQEVRRLLSRAWVLVAPYVILENGDPGALPTILLEAMASETPIISTAVTGIPEILDGGRIGELTPQRDPERLAESIRRCLSERGLCGKRSQEGRRRAEELFDLRKNVAILKALMKSKGSAH